MMQVWFLFKILETIVGTVCIIYHTHGFMDKEPLPHIFLFCGTFFGFTLLAFVGAISIAVSNAPSPFIESVTNFCASVMYFTASIVSMQYAERDQHLMYLSDFEEPVHAFFSFCRAQSVAALLCGALHLLHTILAFDALLDARTTAELNEFMEESDSDIGDWDEHARLRLYFFGKSIEKKLRQNTWFDNLCQRKNPPISIFSGVRKYREADMNPEEYRRKTVYVKQFERLKRYSQNTEKDAHSLRFQISSDRRNVSKDSVETVNQISKDRSSSQFEVPMSRVVLGPPPVDKKKADVVLSDAKSEETLRTSANEHGILKKPEVTADKKSQRRSGESGESEKIKILAKDEKDEKPSTSKKSEPDSEKQPETSSPRETQADGANIDADLSRYVTPYTSSMIRLRANEGQEDDNQKGEVKKGEDEKEKDKKEKDRKDEDEKDGDQMDGGQMDGGQMDGDQKDGDQKDGDQKDDDGKDEDQKEKDQKEYRKDEDQIDKNRKDEDQDKSLKKKDSKGEDEKNENQNIDQKDSDQIGKDRKDKDEKNKDEKDEDQKDKDQKGKDRKDEDEKNKDQKDKDQKDKDQKDKDQKDKDKKDGPPPPPFPPV